MDHSNETTNNYRPYSDKVHRAVEKIDFSAENEFYGKELSHQEKCEIVQNFNDFVDLLLECHNEQTGKKHYIKDQPRTLRFKKNPK